MQYHNVQRQSIKKLLQPMVKEKLKAVHSIEFCFAPVILSLSTRTYSFCQYLSADVRYIRPSTALSYEIAGTSTAACCCLACSCWLLAAGNQRIIYKNRRVSNDLIHILAGAAGVAGNLLATKVKLSL